MQKRHPARRYALRSRSIRIEAVRSTRERVCRPIPLIAFGIRDNGNDGCGTPRLHGSLDASKPGAKPGREVRIRLIRQRRGSGRPHIAHHQYLARDVDVRECVGRRNDDRRIDVREGTVFVRHDVRAHAQRFATPSVTRTAGRHAIAFEREKLEVCAVIAGGLKTNRAAPLGNPHRGIQLIYGTALAATHRIAGQREEIGFQIRLRDAVDGIFDSARRL